MCHMLRPVSLGCHALVTIAAFSVSTVANNCVVDVVEVLLVAGLVFGLSASGSSSLREMVRVFRIASVRSWAIGQVKEYLSLRCK